MRKIGWFDIYVADMERAQAFYETVLDTTLSPMGDPNDPTAEMRSFGDDSPCSKLVEFLGNTA